MSKLWMSSIILILTLMLAAPAVAPAAAQSPSETPFPGPTMRYYSRATLMAGIGVKPYTLLHLSPEFDLGTKFIETFPEGASWFKTFLYLAAENGALVWISIFFVMFFVTGFLLAIFNLRNGRGAKYNLEEAMKELETSKRYTPGRYLKGR